MRLAALPLGTLLTAGRVPTNGRRWRCPCCEAVAVNVDSNQWHCHGCHAGGGSIAMARALATGDHRSTDWAAVMAWCRSKGLDTDAPYTRVEAPASVRVYGTLPPLPQPPEVVTAAGYALEWQAAKLSEHRPSLFPHVLDWLRGRLQRLDEARAMAVVDLIDDDTRLARAAVDIMADAMTTKESITVPYKLGYQKKRAAPG